MKINLCGEGLIMTRGLAMILLAIPMVGIAHNSSEHALHYLELAAANGQRPGVEIQPLDSKSRTDLDFVPGIGQPEHGTPLGYLQLDAKKAAHALLRSELSDKGYFLANMIMSLEEILRQTQSSGNQVRLADDYALEVFGDPATHYWGWKFEGHHLSINLLYSGSETRITPLFVGGSPAEVRTGPHAGMNLFATQTELAAKLVASLDEAQTSRAVGEPLESGGILARGPDRQLETRTGLPVADMTAQQKSVVLRLIALWIENFDSEHAEVEIKKVADGLNSLLFLWRGDLGRNKRQYFQITGPNIYVQFDLLPETLEPESNHNHVHSVWGDPVRDFGLDLLGEHLAGGQD